MKKFRFQLETLLKVTKMNKDQFSHPLLTLSLTLHNVPLLLFDLLTLPVEKAVVGHKCAYGNGTFAGQSIIVFVSLGHLFQQLIQMVSGLLQLFSSSGTLWSVRLSVSSG